MAETAGQGPLAHIKVLDLTRFGAGPSCTMIMADMGAEVLKLEAPSVGDPGRFSPPVVGDISSYFPFYNRNKKSITLNLRDARAKEMFSRLVKWADFVVENFRPGTLGRLGFPFEKLQELNPQVILVSISGFGQTGPYAQRAAFDPVAQAMGGMMEATGRPVGRPLAAGAVIGDNTGGLFGTIGALLALEHRHATGKGQWVDASMMEGQLFHMGLAVVMHPRQQAVAPHSGAVRVGQAESVASGASPSAPAVSSTGSLYRMKDNSWMVILFHDDNAWPKMARIVGRSDLSEHSDYRTRRQRASKQEFTQGLVRDWAATMDPDAAEAILDEAGLPFGKVMSIDDLLKDPHVKARNSIVWLKHDSGETLPIVGAFPVLSASPGSVRTQSPHLGQHNEEIFRGRLGVSEQDFETLKRDNVI